MGFKSLYRTTLVFWLVTTIGQAAVALTPLTLQDTLTPIKPVQPASPLTVVEETGVSIVLRYSAPELKIEKKEKNGSEHYSLGLDGHTYKQVEGTPALPLYSKLLDITGKELSRIKISNIKYSRIYPSSLGFRGTPLPASAPGRKSTAGTEIPATGTDTPVAGTETPAAGTETPAEGTETPAAGTETPAAGTETPSARQDDLNNTFPLIGGNDTVWVESIGTMRGITVGNITIKPLFYNPEGEYIDLVTDMTIEIFFNPTENDSRSLSYLKSGSVTKVLTKGLIGYDPEDVIPGFSLSPVGMIIVADSSMKRHLKPLISWKNRKGFRVYEVYIGEGNINKTYDSIKDTLTKIYKSATPQFPAPEYLLLAGDLNYIPASGETSWLSDMYYGEYDGEGDYLPDLHIGRLPARDTTEMKSIIAKILQYEQFAFNEATTHYKSALAFTGYDMANTNSMNGQVRYAAGYLNSENAIYPHIMLHNSADSVRTVRYDSIRTLINEGVGYINYTGHGDASGWLSTGMNTAWVSTLTNKSRYPVIISNACQTANYKNPNNLGSTFIRSHEKGAVAFIGCSNDSYWNEDFYWSVGVSQITANPTYTDSGHGFYDRLFHTNDEKPGEWYFSMGQILYAGNMAVAESSSSKKKYYWETYTLLGDPSMIPWMGNPSLFDETLPDSIPSILKSITLETEPFAYVALSHSDTLWDASHASPTGAVTLSIPNSEKDSCLITLTGQNRIPLIKTIYFFDPDTAWLSINDINPNDALGNGNGKADFSEQITLDIDLQNAGGAPASDTYLLLQSNSHYLSIVTDSLWVGNVAALSDNKITAAFSIMIHDSVPDLEIVSLDLTLQYGSNSVRQRFDLSLHSPDPVILNSYANDTFTGNGNGMTEAGETVELIFRVANNGSSALSGVLFVTSLNEYLIINQSSVASGVLYPGETKELSVEARVDENTPEATNITFKALFDCYPYITERELGLFSGKSTEDFELNNFVTFPWKNSDTFPWIITENESFQNSFAARSGLNTHNHNQRSALSIQINLPEDDTLTFWYKVSSEQNYDIFIFEIDNVEQFSQSGITNWQIANIPLKKGVHSLSWVYSKDGSYSMGDDCAWIDFIRFPAISFLKNDIALTRIVSPVKNVQYFDEQITVEVTNMGRDTINQLPLSYSLNEKKSVTEYFTRKILPGDTVTLTFRERADLSEPGSYFLSVAPLLADEYAFNDTLKANFISYRYLIQVGPNPFTSSIAFISQGYYEDITVRIYSAGGQIVHIKNFEQFAPGERIEMDLSFLQAGPYYIMLDTRPGTNTYKIIKVNNKP